MEDEESLKSSTLISQLPHSIKDMIHYLLAHCVVTSGIVVGSIFFTSYKLLGMVELTVSSCSHLICNKTNMRLRDKDATWAQVCRRPQQILYSNSTRPINGGGSG